MLPTTAPEPPSRWSHLGRVLGAEAVHGAKAVCRTRSSINIAFGILALAWRQPRLGKVEGAKAVIGAKAVLGVEAVYGTKAVRRAEIIHKHRFLHPGTGLAGASS